MSERLFEDFPSISSETWLAQVEKDLRVGDPAKGGGTPMSRLDWENESGIALSAFYRTENLPAGIDHEFPASGSNRRGNAPWMYAAKPWEICVELPVGDPQKAAKVLSRLEHAPDAVRFVLPENQRHALESKSIGLPGPQSQEDWKALVLAANHHKAAMHLDAGQSFLGNFSAWVEGLQLAGIDLNSVQGSGGTSVLSAIGIQPVSQVVVDGLMADAQAVFSFARKYLPSFRPLVVDLEPHTLQGANGAQELAFALAMAVEYADQFSGQAVGAKELFQSLAFRFPISTDFFAEIARMRAFRMVWTRVLQAYGLDASDPSLTCIYATGSHRHLAGLDAPTNILRSTTAAMSAILGGVASVSVPAFDELSGRPNELSLRLSANLQRVLRHESSLDHVIDPSAGSYYVEQLTDRFAEMAWKEFQEIEAEGGYLACLQRGKFAEKLKIQAEKRAANISKGKTFVLGVNQYPDLSRGVTGNDASVNTSFIPPSANLIAALNAPLTERVEWVMKALATDSIPQVAAAQLQLAPEGIPTGLDHRDAERFEALRGLADGLSLEPAYLFVFGDLTMRQARQNFALNLLGAAGIRSVSNTQMDDLEAAMADCIQRNPKVVVLCGADANYLESAPMILKRIREALPQAKLVLAGKPQGWEALQANGLDTCIFVGMDRLEWLTQLVSTLKTIQQQHHAS